MLFNSYIFVLAFLPIVLIGYFGLNHSRNFTVAKLFLILASLFFYGYFNWSYLLIIVSSVGLNYQFSQVMLSEKIKNVKSQKVAVKVAVPKTSNLSGMSQNEISEWEKILSKVHEGTIVSHKSFGAGTVISFKNGMKKIEVQFSSGTKMFLFPDAFIKGFLKVED